MSYYTAKDGTRIYYRLSGSGEPVIFLHGWTGDCDCYSLAASRLKNQTSLLYDHPGSFRSGIPAKPPTLYNLAGYLNELMDALEFKKVSLVGWSMGAATIFAYVRLFGCKRISRLVLVDMAPKSVCDNEWRIGRFSGEYTADSLKNDLSLAEKDFAAFLHGFRSRSSAEYAALPEKEQRELIAFTIHHTDPATATSLWRSMGEEDFRDVLPHITVPTAVFYADPGSVYSPATGKYLCEHIPCCERVVIFSPASHMLVLEHPVKFADELADFLS